MILLKQLRIILGVQRGGGYDLSMAKDRSWNNEDDDLIANISFYFFYVYVRIFFLL